MFKLRNNSFKNTIYIIFTLTTIIEFMLLVVFYIGRYNSQYERMAKEQQEMLSETASKQLDLYISAIVKSTDNIYFDILRDNLSSWSQKQRLLNFAYQSSNGSVSDISFFDKDGNLIMVSPSLTMKKNVNVSEREWFKKALSDRHNVYFSEPEIENIYINSDGGYEWVIPVSRYVNTSKDGKSFEGVILINFRYDLLSALCSSLSNSDKEYVYLVNSEGDIICHPYQERIDAGFKPENNKELAACADGGYVRTFLGHRRIYAIRTVDYTGWRIISVSPAYSFGGGLIRQNLFLIFIVCIVMIFIIEINDYVASRVADPIAELEHSVKLMAAGQLDAKINISGSSEVRSLAVSVRRMSAKIKRLMADIVREQELKRKSEMDSLQAQINPHFLYNTLDIITWMIERDKKEEATEIVTALARLFRISISKGKNIITVYNEIEHIRNYLVIQSSRYKNTFSYSIKVEEDVKELATIKLVVQPIVENAICHAMEFMEDDGELEVHAYREGDDLYISVKDNGMGMSEEQKEALLKKPVESKRGSGIGVYNVNERIRLYFGAEYGVIINSEPDEGTEVLLHMPAVKYEETVE